MGIMFTIGFIKVVLGGTLGCVIRLDLLKLIYSYIIQKSSS